MPCSTVFSPKPTSRVSDPPFFVGGGGGAAPITNSSAPAPQPSASAGLLSHYLYVAKRHFSFRWGSAWGYARCAWWGVKIGGGCAFHGKTWLRRFPYSRIAFGRNCQFLSSPTANLIGINRPCMVSTMAADAEIRLGNDCGLSGTVIAAFRSITLGDHVICGANTLITDSNWHPEDPRSGSPASVFIGDNVWLGVNSAVLKGVTIGDNSVIGAGSVVTRDIPANAIAAGNPCRVLKILEPGMPLPQSALPESDD